MKVLVIGESGQLARCLKRLLPDAHYLCRQQLDLSETQAIFPVVTGYEPDFIVNAAAYTAVDRAEAELDAARLVNALAVGELASAAAALRVPIIHVSTDFVFAGDASVPYAETDATDPINHYGLTKLEGERALASAAGDCWWILRTSWMFSEFGNNFVRTMLRLGGQMQSLRVVGDQRGRPTYAGDLAEAIQRVILAWSVGSPIASGVYHFASRGEATWYDLARSTLELAHALQLIPTLPTIERIATADYPTPARRPAYSVLATDKLEAALSWQPNDWRVGLKSTLEAL